MSALPETYHCRICLGEFPSREDLIEHFDSDHEDLEIKSYAAKTMTMEEDRDKEALEFLRQLELIKEELGQTKRPCANCGRKASTRAKFCSNCGTKLEQLLTSTAQSA